MRIEKILEKLDKVSDILEQIKKNPIPASVVSMKEQGAMRARIKAVFDLYKQATETKKKRIPKIRKELDAIISTLEKWVKMEEPRACDGFTDTVCGGRFMGFL